MSLLIYFRVPQEVSAYATPCGKDFHYFILYASYNIIDMYLLPYQSSLFQTEVFPF